MYISNPAYLDPGTLTIAISAIIFLAIVVLVPGIIALCVAGSVRRRRKNIERKLHIRK